MDADRRIALLETNLQRQLAWIAAADAKTAFIFAICTAMLGLLAAAAPRYGKWTPAATGIAILAGGLLLITIFGLTAAVFPRIQGPKLSLIFFGAISSRSVDAFRDEVLSVDESGYLEDLIQQCHINAQIAAAKYIWIKRASVALYVALIPWIAAAYMLFRDA